MTKETKELMRLEQALNYARGRVTWWEYLQSLDTFLAIWM